MSDERPDGEQLRNLVMDDLAQHFVVHAVDRRGFWLRRDGRDELDVRVWASVAEIERYLIDFEDDAYESMGIEPAWKSAVSLAAVYFLEEAAMAESGMSVVVDGQLIRRDPDPNATAPTPAGPPARPTAVRLRELVIDLLAQQFVVRGVDERGFDLGRDGLDVRVRASPAEMERYLVGIEESAHDELGLAPAWISAVTLAHARIRDEVAVAEPGTSIVLDGGVVRRDPDPNAEPGGAFDGE